MLCPVCHSPNPATATVCCACGATLQPLIDAAPPLAPGTPLHQGAYRIEGVLGQGGFGITYLAADVMHEQPVAIKEFFPAGCRRDNLTVATEHPAEVASFEAARAKFLQESEVLSHFHHNGIVRVLESFQENNTAYMVMEYLDGKPLSTVMQERGGLLGEGEAIAYVERVGDALEIVHRAGLLHRDIKPDNIMVCHNGRVELIDFGTARDMASSNTQGHTVVVTHGYAPLEQYAKHAQRGVTTDIYALAATLYHLLTGQMPASAIDRANGVALKAPRELRPEISRPVNDAIMWAMQLKVADRPPTVRAFLEALWVEPSARSMVEAKTPPAGLTAPDAEGLIEALPGRYNVKVSNDVVRWPKVCACCGAPATTELELIWHTPMTYPYTGLRSADMTLRSATEYYDWMVPYCADCATHVRRNARLTESAGELFLLGFFFLIGSGALLHFPQAFALWCALASGLILFTTCLIGGLAVCRRTLLNFAWIRKLGSSKADCTRSSMAVGYVGAGSGRHEFVFYNRDYAEQFQALNMPQPLEPAEEPPVGSGKTSRNSYASGGVSLDELSHLPGL
jgi:serine/threonine protein kinase